MSQRNYEYGFERIYDTNQRLQPERKKWDVFENPHVTEASGSMERTKWVDLGEKIAKIVAYLFTFILILGGAVVSKGTLIFMVAQLNNETKTYCNQDLDRNRQFELTVSNEERITWMWMIMFAFFVPQVGTFIRSARKLVYKSWKKPDPIILALVFLSESLMTIGIAILVYVVLPNLDSVKGLMLTNAVCFIPAVLGFASNLINKILRIDFRNDPHAIPALILDLLSMLAQASAFVIWPLLEADGNSLWFILAALLLISCGWWENFAPLNEKFQKLVRFENSRYFIYLFLSLWKCLVFFVSMVAIEWIQEEEITHIFDNFMYGFQERKLNVTEAPAKFHGESLIIESAVATGGDALVTVDDLTPLWVFLINIFATYICYIVGKWACKINIQGFSFSFPINLTIPVSLSILIALCGHYMADNCSFHGTIPLHLFFNLPALNELTDFIAKQQSWIWLLWLLSQAWITRHTWLPKCEKLATTEKLFVRPMYEPFLIDQDLALNRRMDDGADWRDEDHQDDDFIEDIEEIRSKPVNFATPHPDDSITRIYACATMWHETKEEMMEFLKSIFRLDEDQCARRTVREQLGFNLPDYYELETHIFFDDAFVRESQDDPDPQINDFVRMLVSSIDEAASVVHEVDIRLRPPKKIITPYGGRLVWTLPGKTKMIAHLKDKKKIRAKKRWSQVMYMYFLLGHKLMERNDISSDRKDVIGENTFILALDGDIDFQPKAVHLLVELMKKNKNLGAACGRIHPIGSGPLVWYQMFEYAIGHWLQKATEHMIGCVLCSPGCFSLFRGKALMDDGVMRKYTTKSSEARHYVQYDQGEDRWLCTLLLQRGFRVEYAAASDAFTHCPEGFGEFYNQRRRWMPSTTANIIDLLMSARHTIRINDNISRGYIWYQFLLLFGTILGPGTIFLMLVGAFVAVFQWSQWTSFLWNVIPLGFFILTCALFSADKIQLFVAGILSGIYSLVMMAVVIGVILQTTEDGWLAPSSLFFLCLLAVYIITALLHPKEIRCLKFGLVYYVTIPSMYMLLVIYSVFNMNNVSWGTREVTVVAKPENNPNSPTPEAPKEEKKTKNWIIRWCGAKPEDTTGAIEFSIATLFKCIWCTHMDSDENKQLSEISKSLKEIQERLDRIEKTDDLDLDFQQTRRKTGTIIATGAGMNIAADTTNDLNILRGRSSQSPSMQSYNIPENSWLEDDVLQRGEMEFLFNEEEEFWHGLLDRYLHPIDDTKDKARVAQNLKDLRDKMVLAFFMLNALFVLVIFLLTLNRDVIHVQWPFGYTANFTYLDDLNLIWIEKEFLELEPIGIVFLAVFASLIAIQFVGMLFHRFQTFTQVVANTVINLSIWQTRAEKLSEDEMLERNPVEVAKQLQKLKGVDDEKEDAQLVQPARRKTVVWLDQRGRKARETINDLDTAFQRRAGKIIENKDYKGPVRRDTVMAIQRRKSKIVRPSGLMGLDPQNRRTSRLIDLDPPPSRPSRGRQNLGYEDDSSI